MTFKENRGMHFIVIFIIISFLIGIPSFILYQSIQDDFINEVGKNAKGTAGAIAILIEKDIENYKTLLSKDREDNSEYYIYMLSVFQKLKSITGADYIFTENLISDKEIEYILDSEIPNSKNFSPIGTTDSLSTPELHAFKNGEILDSGVINDPYWGYFITGFAPIKDNAGKVVSLVGVDYSLSNIRSIIFSTTIIILIGDLLLSILISSIIYRILNEIFRAKSIDELTGLYSRSYFESKLLREMKHRINEDKKSLSVIMIDVDNFKRVNDIFGHTIGDKVLKTVAEILQNSGRRDDVCARYGGDEFIMALIGSSKEDAIIVSNRILSKIREQETDSWNNVKFALSLSIGIAQWDGKGKPNELMTKADRLLLISKNTGKDKYSI